MGKFMRNTTGDRLSQIFRLVFQLSDGADTSNTRKITEVRWDSLATLTLVAALESEFNLRLVSKEIERLTSYQSALLLLMEKQQ